jgi:hyaluronoglucosaminidase
MVWRIRGIIEGFYGRPWSWDERIELMRFCAERGMTHYVYAPKDDPKHRDRWRDPYDDHELEGFRRLLAEGGLGVGFAISPGLSIDYWSDDDRRVLASKVDSVVDLGVNLVCLALDDIPFGPGLGEAHAGLTSWLRHHLGDRASLLLVPTEYVGQTPTPYLAALSDGVPEDVPIAWTGRSVVNDSITAEQARQRAAAVGGRPPLIWDNYPVNDGIMGDRLYLGPLWGRDAGLADVCSGYLANPMVQPRASKLPLASVAAYLRGDDPLDAWATEAEATGLRIFAEACDGAVPRALVAALVDEGDGMAWADAGAPLAEWLKAARECQAPGLEDEVGQWVEQVRAEAKVGLAALRLVQATRPVVTVDEEGRGRAAAPDPSVVVMQAFSLIYRWPELARSPISVMGLRRGFRPSMGQRADGEWLLLREALQEDENAIDHLARFALDAAASDSSSGNGLRVMADGVEVPLGDDGSFQVSAGATVLVRSGPFATRRNGSGGPPLPDDRLS